MKLSVVFLRTSSDVLLSLVILICVLSINVEGLRLRLDFATAHDLVLSVVCNASCEGTFTWGYKASLAAQWDRPPEMLPYFADSRSVHMKHLESNKTHYIRVQQHPSKIYSEMLQTKTCPDAPPPVDGVRVASAGPGWLDIRWKHLKEECSSRFLYSVNYSSEGAPSETKPRWSAVPLHPCDTWPQEYCILLTDNVRAGRNHTVNIHAVRSVHGVNETERTSGTIVAFADPETTGPASLSNPNSVSEWIVGCSFLDMGLLLPVWSIVVLGIACFLVLLILLLVCKACRKGNEYGEDPPSPIYEYFTFEVPQRSQDAPSDHQRTSQVSYMNVIFQDGAWNSR